MGREAPRAHSPRQSGSHAPQNAQPVARVDSHLRLPWTPLILLGSSVRLIGPSARHRAHVTLDPSACPHIKRLYASLAGDKDYQGGVQGTRVEGSLYGLFYAQEPTAEVELIGRICGAADELLVHVAFMLQTVQCALAVRPLEHKPVNHHFVLLAGAPHPSY